MSSSILFIIWIGISLFIFIARLCIIKKQIRERGKWWAISDEDELIYLDWSEKKDFTGISLMGIGIGSSLIFPYVLFIAGSLVYFISKMIISVVGMSEKITKVPEPGWHKQLSEEEKKLLWNQKMPHPLTFYPVEAKEDPNFDKKMWSMAKLVWTSHLIREQETEDCSKGGKHEFGTDGQHQNEFCKKCYISKIGYREKNENNS